MKATLFSLITFLCLIATGQAQNFGWELRVLKYENNADRPTIVFLHDSLGSIKLW